MIALLPSEILSIWTEQAEAQHKDMYHSVPISLNEADSSHRKASEGFQQFNLVSQTFSFIFFSSVNKIS
jgi:hypothetical protein